MKTLIAAAIFAAVGITASGALAQSVVITNDDGYYHAPYADGGYRERVYRDDEDRGLHRGWYVGQHYGWRRGRCEIVERHIWRHHRLFIERERVCDN
jgi:hypothetical protein